MISHGEWRGTETTLMETDASVKDCGRAEAGGHNS